MQIVIERIDFYNEEIYVDGEENCGSVIPSYVEVDYNVRIGNGWLKGALRDIPFDDYVKFTHHGLIIEIESRLK